MNNNVENINPLIFGGIIIIILVIMGIILMYTGVKGLLTGKLEFIFMQRYHQKPVKGLEGIILSIRNLGLGIVFLLFAYLVFRIVFTF